MKSFKKIAIAFGSLALGVGVIGAVASANGQKNLQQAQAGTQTETVATIDLTADHSLTATTTPWRISGYAGFNSKTSSYYLGGTKATDGAVITYCPTTNPFANVPTQITMTVTGRAAQTLEAGAGSTGDYSKKPLTFMRLILPAQRSAHLPQLALLRSIIQLPFWTGLSRLLRPSPTLTESLRPLLPRGNIF